MGPIRVTVCYAHFMHFDWWKKIEHPIRFVKISGASQGGFVADRNAGPR